MSDAAPPDTRSIDRRSVIIGASFLAAAGIAAWRLPHDPIDYLGARKLEDVIPKRIGPWSFETSSGLVVPPEDQLSRTLYSQLLTRVYTDGANTPVMMLVAQSARETGVLQIHRPEVCYPAGGYHLSPLGQVDIAVPGGTLHAASLSATNDAVTEHMLYWTRIGDRMPRSWAQQREAVAIDNLVGKIPDAVLVRISTVSSDRDSALATLERFIEVLMGTLDASARRILTASLSG